MGKNLSSKYGQKLLDTTNKSGTDTLKTVPGTAILKKKKKGRGNR